MGQPSIGSTLAGYRIEGLIARGGMGVVYRARQLALDRPVALKVISGELAGDDGFRERFLRESRLAARLDHPAVVPVFDARDAEGELIIAMRLVEGGDLRALIDRDGPLDPARAIALLAQVAGALDAAHAAGIVHRDVKPHNILVEGERAYLSDFGLAKAVGKSGVASAASVVGTVEYMSPEQWRGDRVGPAADVYSLGGVLYEALTGVAPFARASADAEPRVPAGLEEVIERAVAKDPAERYPSACALIEAARKRLDGGPDSIRAPGASPTAGRGAGGSASTGALAGDGGRTRRLPRARLPVPRRALSAAALTAAAAIAVVALVVAGEDVSVSAPIPVGGGPLRLAAGAGAIWVASEADGTLTRIDPVSQRVRGPRMRLGPGLAGVAVGAGSVWVSSSRSGQVLRVDPVSGAVTDRIAVGGRPGAVAFGGGRVWVADRAGAGVTAIDARRGTPVKRGIAPHAAPLRLAVGANGLWVSSASTGAVRRIDLDRAVAGAPIPVGRGPAGITVGHGLIWVANSRSGTVTRVDPATHAVLGDPIAIGGRPGGIDAGTSAVWVADASAGTVRRISLESGEPIGDPIDVGPAPGAVTIGADAVWVGDNRDGTVTRLEP